MKLSTLILLVSCIFVLQACAAPGSKTDTLSINHSSRSGVNIALLPAEYRETYFSASGSTERHCRAPDPDFTVQEGVSLSLGANTGVGASENIGVGEDQSAMGLGGRTSTVLIARELMYRACELTANINADSKTTLDTYDKFLEVMERITDAHLSNGTSASGSSIAAMPDSDNTGSDDEE